MWVLVLMRGSQSHSILHKTLQELRMLSRSLSDCQSLTLIRGSLSTSTLHKKTCSAVFKTSEEIDLVRHCVDSANCWAKFIWHLGANHERNPSKHIVRQSSAIKGIDWLDKNILLSLSLNWDEAFFQETVPLWSTYGLHRITVENVLSVQLRLLIYKTTNVPLYIYTGLEIQLSFILILSRLDLHGCCFCGRTSYSWSCLSLLRWCRKEVEQPSTKPWLRRK